MKRSTLILLLVAALGGVLVYFLEIKEGRPRDSEPETTKAAFSFKREDLSALTIKRGEETIALSSQDGKWSITEPVNAQANQTAVELLIGDLVNARVERTIPASGDELKSYGLDAPAVTIEIKLKDGSTHNLKLGSKDFANLSVYGLVDSANEVSLFPASLLTSADKPISELRDLSLLGELSQYEISSLSVRNPSGSFALGKQDAEWKLKSPVDGPADDSEVSSLLSEITSAKATEVASENATDLTIYGLAQPDIIVTAQLQAGGERELRIGLKTEAGTRSYFAKSSDRAPIYKIDQTLYDKLNIKVATLRSKELLKFNDEDVTRVEIKNTSTTLIAEKNSEGKWIVKEPAEQKDKEALTTKILDPFSSNRATEVLDRATPQVAAKLAKPAVEARLTMKDGKTAHIRITSADGDDVYVRVNDRPEIYKVSKSMLDSLTFNAADAVS